MQKYIPTPYLAILFYLAYSNYKKYELRHPYLSNFPEWIIDNNLNDIIDIISSPVILENQNGEDIETYKKDYLFKVSDKLKLQSFLDDYLKLFETDKLIYTENFYKYTKNILKVAEVWHNDFDIFGKRIILNISLDASKYPDKKFRIIEVVMSLIRENFINLVCVLEQTSDDIENQIMHSDYSPNINIVIEFIKSPEEITDIKGFWTYYGDIRINEKEHIASYKNNHYTIKSTYSSEFKLLCYLVKNHGKKIPIKELKKILGFSDNVPKNKQYVSNQAVKDKIKGYIKEIKKKLSITNDKEPTIDIKTVGDSIIMISTPIISKTIKISKTP